MFKGIYSAECGKSSFFILEKYVVSILWNVSRGEAGILHDILKFHGEKFFKKQLTLHIQIQTYTLFLCQVKSSSWIVVLIKEKTSKEWYLLAILNQIYFVTKEISCFWLVFLQQMSV